MGWKNQWIIGLFAKCIWINAFNGFSCLILKATCRFISIIIISKCQTENVYTHIIVHRNCV